MSYQNHKLYNKSQQHHSNQAAAPQSPPPQPINYYTADDKIDHKWVDAEAQKAARTFASAKEIKLNYAQLRKFYGEVKTMELRLRFHPKGTEEAFKDLLPHFKLLKAKANYAQERKVAPPEFTKWLAQHVDSVNKYEDFKAFLLHFEAVVGFSKIN